jgi:glycosyltransferase involved in cell wall biosynthesis
MCSSLAGQGYEVMLIVADGKGDEINQGINIMDVGASKGRFDRIRNAPKRVFAKAAALKADLYHLHDPELIPIGLKLKRMGYRVIFDSHEDVPRQMLGKSYLNKPTLWLIAKGFAEYEKRACTKLDGVIAATPSIRDKFLAINPQTEVINNFPLLHELNQKGSWVKKRKEVCYVGSIDINRGIQELCLAMGQTKSGARLNLAGEFSEPEIKLKVQHIKGWQNINELKVVDRAGVKQILCQSIAGLVTFRPLPNHVNAQPNKMFEYMSAGIPLIASDFPLWRKIINENDCGLLINPLDSAAIAKAIDYVIENPNEAERMGKNGRRAVEEIFNWGQEEKKLLQFYEQILQA